MMRSGLALLAVAAALTGGFTYYNSRVVPARYAGQSRGPLRLAGLVGAETVAVSPEIGGLLESLLAEEGDVVEEGHLLARLRRPELDARLAAQAARIAQMAARLRQARELASLEEEQQRGQLARSEAELEAVRSERALALAEVRQRESELGRASQLLAQGILAPQEAERAGALLETAQSRARALEHRESAARSERETILAGRHRQRAARLEIEQAQSLLRQERAVLGALETERARTAVRAPIAGVVSLRTASQGEMVRAGSPILTLVDPERTWVSVAVEETALGGLAPGAALPVELATGERLEGELLTLAPEAGFATQRDVDRIRRDIRTFRLKVGLPNSRRTVHAGMTAYVTLHARP